MHTRTCTLCNHYLITHNQKIYKQNSFNFTLREKMAKDSKPIVYASLGGLILLSALSFFSYLNMQKQYRKLDEKFTATAESLKIYKATIQNQGLYYPLKKDVDNLKEYTEGFFEGSERNALEFSEELQDLRERVDSLEERTHRK